MAALEQFDVIIIGAGAAGLMCAIEAGKRNRTVLILEHGNKPGKKILMSGGGRCNFTNYYVNPDCYISQNAHFCKSALNRYTQWNFIELVNKHQIPYHEKTKGQLFCDHKSKAILEMLLSECEKYKVDIRVNIKVENIKKDQNYTLKSNNGDFCCESLVIASGGLSIPTMGASPFGYKVAEQFGIKVCPTRAGLVPFTLQEKEELSPLSGISIDSLVSCKQHSFRENILFTHRGLSGPAILQISSYWKPGEEVSINLLPDIDLLEYLKMGQKQQPLKQLNTYLAELIPKRVIEKFLPLEILEKKLAASSHHDFQILANKINHWIIKPSGTEGYRTAEVTLGGVDCNAISSKTMESNTTPGLYFIGEVLDVSGWLGGYNFQWAWSSGWAAGQVV